MAPRVNNTTPSNPTKAVEKGLSIAGKAHKAADIVHTALHEPVGPVARHAARVSHFFGKVLGPVAVVGGGYKMGKGVGQIRKGDTAKGTHNIAQGGLSAASGGAAMLGSTAAGPLAAGAAGMAIGRYGDKNVKKLGILKGRFGKPTTASGRLADRALAVQRAVKKKTGSRVLGHAAAFVAGVAMLPGAGLTALFGAVVGRRK